MKVYGLLFVILLSASSFARPSDYSDPDVEDLLRANGNDYYSDNSGNFLTNGVDRVARYIFGGSSSNHQSPSQAKSGNSFALNVDTISQGVLQPNNIAVHVAQNTVNYVASTLAWGAIALAYSAANANSGRSSQHSYVPTSHYYTSSNPGLGKSLQTEFSPSDLIESFKQKYSTSQSSTDQQQYRPSNILSKRHSFAYADDNDNDNIKRIRKILRKVANSSKSASQK